MIQIYLNIKTKTILSCLIGILYERFISNTFTIYYILINTKMCSTYPNYRTIFSFVEV